MPKKTKSPASAPLTGTIVETEMFYLRSRNAELAKALAESKDANTKLTRQLFDANLKIQELSNALGIIKGRGSSALAGLVEASNDLGEIGTINRTSNGLQPPGNANFMKNAKINKMCPGNCKLQTIREEVEGSFNSPASSCHPPPLIPSGLYPESAKIHSTINQKRGNSSTNSPNLRLSSPPIKKEFVENIDDRLQVERKSFVSSCSQTAALSHSYDPLEGPSTLLDEPQYQLSHQILRLSPRKLQTSTPQEPADRHIEPVVSLCIELSDESQTPKKLIMTRNIRMSPRVVLTRITLDELKKIETRREESEPSTSTRTTRSKKKQSNENNESSDKSTNRREESEPSTSKKTTRSKKKQSKVKDKSPKTKATFKVNKRRKSVVLKESPKSTRSTPSTSSNSSTLRRSKRKAVDTNETLLALIL